MKKKLHFLRPLIALSVLLFAFTANAIVVPYLPPLQSFSGTSVTLATFSPTTSDYTLEVQGTVGTPITVAGSVYTYTPTTSGTVRFSQKKGIVYVYESNVYMTTLTPSYYPTITNADVATNTNNLLRNASFETPGAKVGTGTQYNFGTPWTTNVTVAASGGIRISDATAGNANGTWECVWRGTGNANYFGQPLLATIKPNTTYKVIVNQLTGSNSYANFSFGLGSTASGMEYNSQFISLGNTKNGTWSTILTTPASGITSTSYFTVKNSAANTATPSNQTDALTQIDYIALVETSATATPGITGATSATYLSGTAYAPENIAVNYTSGDYYDMASYITNNSFESGLTGWTNSGFVTQTNTPGQTWVKDGTTYVEKYIASGSNLAAGTISQTVSGLPNGKYRLTVSAHAIQQSNAALVTTGGFAVAGASSTAVNVGGTYTVDNVPVVAGSLSIGYKLEAPITCNWTGFDNFKLYYLGPISDPVISAPQATAAFTTATNTAAIDLTGANLTSDITITVPSTHITLSGTNVTGTSPNYSIALANANQLNSITATWDKAVNVSDTIRFTSGSVSKKVNVTSSDVESVALSGITLSAGGLTTPFSVGTTSYTVKVPADLASATVTATTTPSVATVTNNVTAISSSATSVVLTGNSYNGATHTADYTVNWGGNFAIADWAANGSTDANLSLPTIYGWSATPTLTWIAANATNAGTVRYMDMVAGVNAGIGGITYTYGGSNYDGRIMFVRWDGGVPTRVYSYPVVLESCKTYNFATKAAYNSVATAGTLTFKINTAKDNTGTNYATGTIVTTTAGTLINGGISNISVPTTGVYYLTVTSSTANLCALADLSLTENATEALSVSKTYTRLHSPASGQNTTTFTISGNALANDVTLAAPAGIILSAAEVTSGQNITITKANAQCGVTVTATYDGSANIVGGTIAITSGAFSNPIIVDALNNNKVEAWDALGSTDATASVPSAQGWASNGTITWIAANLATGGTSRYIDVPAGYTSGGNPFKGRILYLRWDASNTLGVNAVYSFPATLQAGKTYTFTGKAAFNTNDVAGVVGIKVNSAADNSGSTYGGTNVTTTTFGTLINGSFSFSVPADATYYLTFTCNKASLNAVADLAILEETAPLVTVYPTTIAFNKDNLAHTFRLTGNQLASNVSISAPAGVTLSSTGITSGTDIVITKEEAANGVDITATFDNATTESDFTINAISGALTSDVTMTFAPTILVDKASLSTYAPYDSQTIGVRGINLTGDIAAAITGTNAAMYSANNSLFTQLSGSVSASSISVQYVPSAQSVDFHVGTLTLSSPGAADVTFSLEGNSMTTQIGGVNGKVITTVRNNNLIVSGATSYSVYNAQGMKVADVKVNNGSPVALTSGVYLVKTAGKVQKVLVK